MILRLYHDTGRQLETSMAYPGELDAVEVARCALDVLEHVTRVMVWDEGLSPVSDKPSADVVRTRSGGPVLVDEDTREAREALAEWLADALCGAFDDQAGERPVVPASHTIVLPGVVARSEAIVGFQGPV